MRGKKHDYKPFKKNGDLAECIGVVLGDGHIEKFPRTQRLLISSNANNPGFVQRYANLVEKIFDKKPSCAPVKNANCIRISIYQNAISERLGIPSGDRRQSDTGIPQWVFTEKGLLMRCLRGLYEAEGSFTIHIPTCTYKSHFSNRNARLLRDVYQALQMLEFSPLYERYRITISKKKEFFRLKDLLNFRKY